MSGNGSRSHNDPRRLTIDTPSALASIKYNSVIASDKGTSSEDEASEAQDIAADDARTAIGISISRQQTRLTSPKTPATEKVAAIERAGGFFEDAVTDDGALVEEPDEENEQDTQKDGDRPALDGADEKLESSVSPLPDLEIPERSQRKTEVRLPSPWRVESTARWQTPPKPKSGLLDGIFNRRRASSGPEGTLEGRQKSIFPSLPSLPKNFLPTLPFSNSQESKDYDRRAAQTIPKISGSSSFKLDSSSGSNSTIPVSRGRAESIERITSPIRRGQAPISELARQRTAQSARDRAGLLRRSTSDQSLVTQRTVSTVESLGDDTRFENIHDQVNNRFKAIKDSWQDSNIRLPSLSNFSVSSFTPEFVRERASSLNRRSIALHDTQAGGAKRGLESRPKPVDPVTRQHGSTKAALSDTAGKTTTHPHFSRALEHLEGDIVILGGYRGSILRSAEPPHRQYWVPVKVGLNLRKVNLEVGLEKGDDERAAETVIADGMLTHIGPVDIARRLFKRLRSCKNARAGRLRIHDYGYDWRLDPTYLSNNLVKFLEGLPCNRAGSPKHNRGATVIAHSLGGLITRHAVNQRPDLFKGVVYAGVPRTCVNILGPMRNGDEVLLSSRVLTAQVNFSIRTSYALLPLDGRCFFDKNTREEYPVDFFDPQTWVDFRLSPCVGRPLPPLQAQQKGISGYMSSMASVLPGIPGRGRKPSLRSKSPADLAKPATVGPAAEPDMAEMDRVDSNQVVENENGDIEADASPSARTAVTIPREKALEYLTRTLAEVKQFKLDLRFNPDHSAANKYPPIAVIYGKSTPTVFGAKVDGKEGIKHSDAYDELAFASGDGVVLARAAQVPQGYTTARGGVVSSERGHVTLLSDLEAVGKCLNAITSARKKGVGTG